MGMTYDELNKQLKLKQVRPFVFSTTSVPNGHPDFDYFTLLITPGHGLCKINASTKTISTSAYGNEIRSKFEGFESSLSSKYGKVQKFDRLRSGSIWKEPRDWMMGLRKKERTLASFWEGEESPLPDKLGSISLEAVALNTENGFIKIGYEFKNSSECIDWLKTQRDSSL